MALPEAAPHDKKAALIGRVKNLLLNPDIEWQVIEAEPATIGSIYKDYVLILAAIPALAKLLGGLLFGYGAFGFVYHPSVAGALSTAILGYLLTLVGVFLLAVIIDFLAPVFQGQRNQVQAMKLAAYSATASWLAGIFFLIPGLRLLSILGLYSLYLFYKGLPTLMKAPRERTIPYTALVIVIAIVLSLLIAPLTAIFVGGGGPIGAPNGAAGSGSLQLPGGSVVNLDKLQQASRSLEAAANHQGDAITTTPVAIETLKGFLPADLPDGTARTEISTGGGQVAGMGGAMVDATYKAGDARIELSVTDLGPAGALAALGGALGANGSHETPTSYSKMDQIGGRTIIEEYDRSARTGSFSVVVASRFLVKADGSGTNMETLKSAVNAVDLASLDALAK